MDWLSWYHVITKWNSAHRNFVAPCLCQLTAKRWRVCVCVKEFEVGGGEGREGKEIVRMRALLSL